MSEMSKVYVSTGKGGTLEYIGEAKSWKVTGPPDPSRLTDFKAIDWANLAESFSCTATLTLPVGFWNAIQVQRERERSVMYGRLAVLDHLLAIDCPGGWILCRRFDRLRAEQRGLEDFLGYGRNYRPWNPKRKEPNCACWDDDI